MDDAHEATAQQQITAFWSTVATAYEDHGGNVPALDSAEYAAWVDAIRGLLPPPPSDVLDVGTGTGFAALIAAGPGHRVTGLDASKAMLHEARSHAVFGRRAGEEGKIDRAGSRRSRGGRRDHLPGCAGEPQSAANE